MGADFFKSVLGGDQVAPPEAHAEMTGEERQRLVEIEQQLKAMSSEAGQPQDAELQNMFRSQLVNFLGRDFGGAPTPEQLQQATSFVDQTFTAPAQEALRQTESEAQTAIQANTAALGRNPNLDVATQQAIAGEIARQRLGLQAERGARIGEQANVFTDRGFNQGIGQLQAGMSGSGFLNDLAQRSFENRLNLLNARTGVANIYQSNRLRLNQPGGTTPGLLGTLSSAAVQGATAKAGLGYLIGGSATGAAGAAGAAGATGAAATGSSLGAAIGAAAMFSDINTKKNIEDGSEATEQFLDSLSPYIYEYKNADHGEGKHLSVMAQDLEKSEFGKKAIIETPEGKMVDYVKLLPAIVSAQAHLNKRLNEVERRG